MEESFDGIDWNKVTYGEQLVLKVLADVVYRIQRTPRSKPQVVHGDRLKKYQGEPLTPWVTTEEQVEEPATQAPVIADPETIAPVTTTSDPDSEQVASVPATSTPDHAPAALVPASSTPDPEPAVAVPAASYPAPAPDVPDPEPTAPGSVASSSALVPAAPEPAPVSAISAPVPAPVAVDHEPTVPASASSSPGPKPDSQDAQVPAQDPSGCRRSNRRKRKPARYREVYD